ncbi:MAG: ribonuclease R [Lachnospirales bacterium]
MNYDQGVYSTRRSKILEFIKDNQDKPITKKELIYIMEVPKTDFALFNDVIADLEENGEIVQTTKGKLVLPEKLNLVVGTFLASGRGFGFVTFDDDKADVFISFHNANGASHKDKVLCKVKNKKTGKRSEGEVLRVIKKGINQVVGTYQCVKKFAFVVPDNKKVDDIFIPEGKGLNAITGHKVVVDITKPAFHEQKAEGEVVEILGHKNDVGIDVLSIIKDLQIPTVFPEEVMEEVSKIPMKISESDFEGREDRREEYVVTIDGDDTKDIDDGFSLVKLDNGNFNLCVYIADVTHYVKEDSPLDIEAINRGTSVYLADRVIPMLPHALSNGICSLNAHEDRLALACEMEIDNKGEVINHKVFNAVINVNKRLTYSIVKSLLLEKDESFYYSNHKEEYDMLNNSKELASILNKKRMKNGSIDFNFVESKLIVDENGKLVDIVAYERNIATNLIEEFMLITNSTIAENFFWQDIPFVYRNHESPEEEKLEKVKKFIAGLGFYLKGNDAHPKEIQNLIKNVQGTSYEYIISRFVLRAMQQARYSAYSNGHYGLAIRYYTHFTSPIRRYPDLQIHRIIKESIAGELTEDRIKYYDLILPDICKSSSVYERRAEEAERETNKYKKVEFMEDKIGEVFKGVISGVTTWGLYVELENTVEGMVSIHSLDDDHYYYDENNLAYIGTHKSYSIGQMVYIKVINANKETRHLDFEFVEGEESNEQ